MTMPVSSPPCFVFTVGNDEEDEEEGDDAQEEGRC
jgi:hypothetical protein